MVIDILHHAINPRRHRRLAAAPYVVKQARAFFDSWLERFIASRAKD
jgi:hypothetical protein